MGVIKPIEIQAYQDFLVSEYRESLIPKAFYDELISPGAENINILEYNCGQGYLTILLGEKFLDNEAVKIYGCDHFNDLLDVCWGRIVKRKTKNVTVFFIPERPAVYFPPSQSEMKKLVKKGTLICPP